MKYIDTLIALYAKKCIFFRVRNGSVKQYEIVGKRPINVKVHFRPSRASRQPLGHRLKVSHPHIRRLVTPLGGDNQISVFHVNGLENTLAKLHDLSGFPRPTRTLLNCQSGLEKADLKWLRRNLMAQYGYEQYPGGYWC